MRWHNWFILVLGLLPACANADKVSAAVASNFAPAMHAIAEAFAKETGHTVESAFGSSGKFYAQISNAAPFQVFFSADTEKPLALEQDGLAVPGTRFSYALGTLVLWSSRPGLVDLQAEVLKRGHFNKLALANPKLAPYGAAAVEVLQHLGIAESSQAKLVFGENIAQTYQFVETGNVELGFIALSQISDKNALKQGSTWIVPASLHRPIRQDAVLLQAGADSTAARELLRFVQNEKAQSIILAHGYRTATE